LGWPQKPGKAVPWAMDWAAQKHPLTCFLRGPRGSLRASIRGFDVGERKAIRDPQKPKLAVVIRDCAPMVGCHAGA
jgi:hypothetical protein